MSTQIKTRRGTTTEHSTFVGSEAELTVDTTKDTVVVHDGSTAGGHPLAKTSSNTFTADQSHGDNVKAKFGASDDLQIYHDGSKSYIQDTGTGDLYIQGSNQVRIGKAGTYENGIVFNEDNAVQLYYDASEKLATTATGVAVTGGITTSTASTFSSNLTVSSPNASTKTLLLYGVGGDQSATTLTLISSRADVFYHAQFFRSGSTEAFRVESSGNVKNANNSYGALSDVKLKENITDASPKLSDLMQVRVRNYNLIDDDVKQLGVIAQELETIFPSMVDENEDRDSEGNFLGTTTKGVKYSVFVPVLIKAMQEQQTLIETQTATIQELIARIEALENV